MSEKEKEMHPFRSVMIDGQFQDELLDECARVSRQLRVIKAKLELARKFEEYGKEIGDEDVAIIDTSQLPDFPEKIPEVSEFSGYINPEDLADDPEQQEYMKVLREAGAFEESDDWTMFMYHFLDADVKDQALQLLHQRLMEEPPCEGVAL